MFFFKKLFKIREEAAKKRWEDTEKPFLDHLDDLRGTLMKIIITVLVFTIAAFVFNKQLLEIVNYPISIANIPEEAKEIRTISPVEPFTVTIKICLYAAIILSFPMLLYFLGEFILPGLTDKERKMILPSLAVGFALFLSGVLFCFFVVNPRAIEFFYYFAEARDMQYDLRVRYYVGFVTQLTLVFGLCFQLPVVVMALVKLELLTYRLMADTRSYAIIIMFVVAAIITPTTDVFTLSLLAGPMVVLYEICIWLAWGLERKRERAEKAEKEREAERTKERARRKLEAEKAKAESGEAMETEAEPTEPSADSSTETPIPEAREDTKEFSYDPDNAVEHTEGDTSDEVTEAGESQDSDVDDHHGDHAAHDDGHGDDTWHDDQRDQDDGHGHDQDPHQYDDDHYHDHYHDDYNSGPTEELKRTLREELKDELKGEIKAELREELLTELRRELGLGLKPEEPKPDEEPSDDESKDEKEPDAS